MKKIFLRRAAKERRYLCSLGQDGGECKPCDGACDGAGKGLDKPEGIPVWLNGIGQEAWIYLENQGVMHMNQATKAIGSVRWEQSFDGFFICDEVMTVMVEMNGQYTCNEYRQEMVLLGLRRRLEQEDLTDEERRELRARLMELESEMELD